MTRALLTFLSLILFCLSSYALSGGPVYPVDTSANQGGTYQAILRGRNLMGLTIFGVSGSTANGSANTTTAGISLFFYEGLTSSGFSFGIGGPATSELACFFEASRTRLGGVNATFTEREGTPQETTSSFFVNDVMFFSGSYEAKLDRGVVFANFHGEGRLEFSEVANLDSTSNVNGTIETSGAPSVQTRTIDFTVFGARTSIVTTSFSGFSTVDQPSVISLN